MFWDFGCVKDVCDRKAPLAPWTEGQREERRCWTDESWTRWPPWGRWQGSRGTGRSQLLFSGSWEITLQFLGVFDFETGNYFSGIFFNHGISCCADIYISKKLLSNGTQDCLKPPVKLFPLVPLQGENVGEEFVAWYICSTYTSIFGDRLLTERYVW